MLRLKVLPFLLLFIILVLLLPSPTLPLTTRPPLPVVTRGSNYQKGLTADDAARKLKIKPPLKAPRFVWRAAWNVGKLSLRLLPRLTRSHVPVNSNVNLSVLQWKALSGDPVARSLLPGRLSKLTTHPRLLPLYPRLHHANVELRTAYISAAVDEAIKSLPVGDGLDVVVAGCGFDTLGLRLLTKEPSPTRPLAVTEFDLPDVVESKSLLLSQSPLPPPRELNPNPPRPVRPQLYPPRPLKPHVP